MNGHDVMARLKAAGWVLDRVAGSHHVWTKDGKAVPIPVHGKRDLGEGLLSAIQRQTGVKLK
ncbi:MAG: type II toxin-antitoxin system HicA family toxin [Magnetococcales bacterium]|nr:type II toxin-antitoxin system HicA family toxin [Magnetococcales bacterium]MBF0263126.1 type II toxin-antitoxin system HicA family toxin [Magnetococcales bacterium]